MSRRESESEPRERPDRTSIVFGFHPVREALRRRPQQVAELWVAGSRRGRRVNELVALAERHRVAVKKAAEAELSRRSSGPHNGFLAVLRAAPAVEPSADADLVVLLEDVQDPRNLGAVLRVCEGAGVGRVLIRDRGSAPVTPIVVKAAAGATEWLSLERITNTAQELERLKADGFWVYGSDPQGVPPWSLDLSGKVVLCLGGEHRGLRTRTRALCDVLVGLPMSGRVESLNVATAAAALLYEAVRQRVGEGS